MTAKETMNAAARAAMAGEAIAAPAEVVMDAHGRLQLLPERSLSPAPRRARATVTALD
jgi:hypothetical protein